MHNPYVTLRLAPDLPSAKLPEDGAQYLEALRLAPDLPSAKLA